MLVVNSTLARNLAVAHVGGGDLGARRPRAGQLDGHRQLRRGRGRRHSSPPAGPTLIGSTDHRQHRLRRRATSGRAGGSTRSGSILGPAHDRRHHRRHAARPARACRVYAGRSLGLQLPSPTTSCELDHSDRHRRRGPAARRRSRPTRSASSWCPSTAARCAPGSRAGSCLAALPRRVPAAPAAGALRSTGTQVLAARRPRHLRARAAVRATSAPSSRPRRRRGGAARRDAWTPPRVPIAPRRRPGTGWRRRPDDVQATDVRRIRRCRPGPAAATGSSASYAAASTGSAAGSRGSTASARRFERGCLRCMTQRAASTAPATAGTAGDSCTTSATAPDSTPGRRWCGTTGRSGSRPAPAPAVAAGAVPQRSRRTRTGRGRRRRGRSRRAGRTADPRWRRPAAPAPAAGKARRAGRAPYRALRRLGVLPVVAAADGGRRRRAGPRLPFGDQGRAPLERVTTRRSTIDAQRVGRPGLQAARLPRQGPTRSVRGSAERTRRVRWTGRRPDEARRRRTAGASPTPRTATTSARTIATLREDVEDLHEPVDEITQFDECMFTVGVKSRARATIYRTRRGVDRPPPARSRSTWAATGSRRTTCWRSPARSLPRSSATRTPAGSRPTSESQEHTGRHARTHGSAGGKGRVDGGGRD